MPRRNGRKTPNERVFAEVYAVTGDREYAGAKAGYAVPASGASQALQRPAVQAEIARIQQEKLFSTVLPLAVQVHTQILLDPKAPAGARVQAVKLAYDRTLGLSEAMGGKEAHEMTAEEIAKAIEQLQRVAADRAKPVIEGEASSIDEEPLEEEPLEEVEKGGIFD